MKKLTQLTIALVALIALGTACSEHRGFKKDKQGFYYKFYEKNKNEAQPQVGDIVELTYTLRTSDSILVDNVPMHEEIIESIYTGDIYAALRMMHLGDSATFILNGDTFFHYFMRQPFRFEKKDLYFDLKLHKITSPEKFEQIQMEQRRRYEAMIEELRLEEDDLINNYISDNNIKTKPTNSGLYLIKTANGSGKAIKNGSKVAVHYTGKFIDGTVFDSSTERGIPLEFTVGEERFIAGWDEAILLLRGGDRATALLPSKLAYGARGLDYAIPPYTPIIFDLEVVSVQ